MCDWINGTIRDPECPSYVLVSRCENLAQTIPAGNGAQYCPMPHARFYRWFAQTFLLKKDDPVL